MSEWKEVRLGDVCDIYDGPHATPPKVDFGFIFLGISSLGFDGRIDPTHFEYVSEQSFKKWTRRIEPRYRDIVFSYETKLGVAAMIPNDFRCCLGRRMGLIRTKDGIDPRFLLYAYLAPDFQKTIYKRTYHGSTVDRIPLKEMPDFPIRIPDIKEQKAIASVLSSLDDKIDLLHRQNKTLEAMAETIFRQWFVEEAEDDWEEVQIKDLCSLQYGLTQSANINNVGPHFLRITDIQGGKVSWERVPYCIASEKDFTKYQLKTGDIVVARTGASTGENLYIYKPPISVFASYLIRMQFSSLATGRYVAMHMRSAEYFEYVGGIVAGSAQPNANAQMLSSFTLRLPPEQLQEKFNSWAQVLDEKIYQNQIQIRTLEKLRDTLLPKLMSGEVRVAI